MTFGGGSGIWGQIGKLQQADAERLVGQAIDGGVNFIDTADVYAGGVSEQITGKALKNLKGLMVWSPLAGGLLSGKFSSDGDAPKDSRRHQFDFPPVEPLVTAAITNRARRSDPAQLTIRRAVGFRVLRAVLSLSDHPTDGTVLKFVSAETRRRLHRRPSWLTPPTPPT